MPRKKETLTLSVPPGTKEKLEDIAQRLDIKWGDKPSASGLIGAIALSQLEVGQPFTLDANQVTALKKATEVLIDSGSVEEAQILLSLLVNRGNLQAPLRQSLLQKVSQPTQAWRILVDQQIARKQPFHVVYTNSQKQQMEYTARYAEICFYEKRYYLQIWCDETEDSDDLPELRHNRCLRLDRINGILPIEGQWRDSLDSIKVYLHFKNWLANAYEPKLDDLNEKIVNGVKQVGRRVVNSFWLIREVFRYGPDCEIVAPDAVRQRFKQELTKLYQLYQD
ncbi:YafY family protein [Planktothrix sp. FACHB-1365]|uniref:helix-turn-helix transcriptional regulator n=1 Tax=Planktothrix sp. FACHB-1365 TaxID=2692855 RepID=UPI0016835DCC|nr:WYL domain-containing protein [Planktothrix sp. FACHB-1365]MBD2482145.1 WYL domain-containing protein [Planktothrix sp. FACHB-1365]